MNTNPQNNATKEKRTEGYRYTWSEVWIKVITKPTRQTFYEILHDPSANVQRAYLWTFVAAMVNFFITYYILISDPTFMAAVESMQPELAGEIDAGVMMTSALCMLPFAGMLGVFVLWTLVWAIQFAADQIGPKEKTFGHMPQILYSFAAFYAPLNIISSLLMILSPTGIAGYFIWGYRIYLQITAVQTVYKFDIQKATMTVIIPATMFFILQIFLIGTILI